MTRECPLCGSPLSWITVTETTDGSIGESRFANILPTDTGWTNLPPTDFDVDWQETINRDVRYTTSCCLQDLDSKTVDEMGCYVDTDEWPQFP